ncbi:hypothetical protein B0H15DRAFT_1020996 [Mycena belliarum]|uniref:Zn(2)-C6 fungal-type domain-containing protein n=1 Tax=Mycena belliarum TaxID=1033014 RepID=A0AAD6U6S0_9AGAR|nr:hypothetical protein B0H15DRAFT_1020996 [Mycena belliae]
MAVHPPPARGAYPQFGSYSAPVRAQLHASLTGPLPFPSLLRSSFVVPSHADRDAPVALDPVPPPHAHYHHPYSNPYSNPYQNQYQEYYPAPAPDPAPAPARAAVPIRQPSLPRLPVEPGSSSGVPAKARFHPLYSMQPTRATASPDPDPDLGARSRSRSPAPAPVRLPRRTTTTAVIACRQCRARKIRCDSTRPHCANCARRADGPACAYDPAPKRRGPDKRPGTRQRRCKPREPPSSSSSFDPPSSSFDPNTLDPSAAADPADHDFGAADTNADAGQVIALPAPPPVPQAPHPGPRALRIETGALLLRRPPAPRPPSSASTSTSLSTPASTSTSLSAPLSLASAYGYSPPFRSAPAPAPVSAYEFGFGSPYEYGVGVAPYSAAAGYSNPGPGPADPGPGPSYGAYDSASYDPAYGRPSAPYDTALPPALRAAHARWWGAFLRAYTVREVATEVAFLCTAPSPLLAFLNRPALLAALYHPPARTALPPALVLAALALAALLRSSDASSDAGAGGGAGAAAGAGGGAGGGGGGVSGVSGGGISGISGGRGAEGRARAAGLREAAEGALEGAWGALGMGFGVDGENRIGGGREGMGEGVGGGGGGEEGWEGVGVGLGGAALLLALYEASAHPAYHPDRLAAALARLDAVLSGLRLTSADARAPGVCRFARGAAPSVYVPAPAPLPVPSSSLSSPASAPTSPPARSPSAPPTCCACLPPGSPGGAAGTGTGELPWDPAWDARAVRAEEVRRLCWGALGVATGWRAECMALGRPDGGAAWAMCEPANYALLFPNEVYTRERSGGAGEGERERKNAVWALCCRAMLLANFCGNVAVQAAATRAAREAQAEALQDAWHDALAVQDALDAHTCGLHAPVAYRAREHVYNAQMIITKVLRGLQGLSPGTHPGPLFNRRQAEEWIQYQSAVVRQVTHSIQYLGDPRGAQLTQRPFTVPWFAHQLAICLLLWEGDMALHAVLELAKGLLVPLAVLNALWPCPLIRQQCAALQKRLAAHCRAAGLEPPPDDSGYALPAAAS